MQRISFSDLQSLPNSTEKNVSTQETILIVEDDTNVGALLVELLAQETPLQPLLVKDGLQALNMATRITPKLMITDYRMPYMDGLELCDRLHDAHLFIDVPVIFMSGHLPPEEEMKKRKLVGITKPFDLDKLLKTVEHLLNQQPRQTH